MHLQRLIYSPFGRYAISIILGLGLASLFRKVCNERNCLVFKGPPIEEFKKDIYEYNDQCYTFKPKAVACDNSKKTVDFA